MSRVAHAVVAIALCLAVAGSARAEILEQIIVKVNGDIITKTEFEQRQAAALRVKYPGISSANPDQLKNAIAEITPELIVDAVDELLLLQRGRELDIKLSDEQFNNIVQQIRKENHLESDEAFQTALKQEGMSMDDLRRNLEKQMIISRVQSQEVNNKVGITEEEARKYHDEHLDEFTKPGTVTLREIFVDVKADSAKGVSVAADQEARAKIDRLRERVMSGEAFEKVAAEASTAASRANGGLIGPLNPSELAPALQDLIKNMKPGDVSEVLRTPKGYQILKLESRTDPVVLTAEQAHDQIGEKIFEQKRQRELKKYIARLRAEAIIDWKNDELKKAYDAEIARERTEDSAAPAAPAAAPAEQPPTH